MTQHIAVRVKWRNKNGDLVLDLSVVARNTRFEGLCDVAAKEVGDMVAYWRYTGEAILTGQKARTWVGMVYPDRIYMKSSWGEMILADDAYQTQMEE